MAIVGAAQVLVTPSFVGFQKAVGAEVNKTMPAAGRTAGAAMGGGMAAGVRGASGAVTAATGAAAAGAVGASQAAGASAGTGFVSRMAGTLRNGAATVTGTVRATFSGAAAAAATAGTATGTSFMGGVTRAVAPLAAIFGGAAVLGGGFSRLANIEDAEAKLTGLGHSAETVTQVMDSALASVQGTAFGLDEAASIAASLIASGIQPGQELEGVLKGVADAATIGGTSLGDMGAIYAKVAAGGRIQGEELAQLGDRGIPILQLLSEHLGVSAEEVRTLASEGEIGFADFAAAMEGGMAGAALQSGETTRGTLRNVGAAVSRLGATIMEELFPKIKEWGATAITVIDEQVIPAFQGVVQWARDNSEWLLPLVAGLGAIVAVIGTMVTVVKTVTAVKAAWVAVQTLLNTAMLANPIGLIVLAIAGLVAAVVVAYQQSETFRNIVTAAWEGIKTAANAVWTFLRDVVFAGLKAGFAAVADWFSARWLDIQRYWDGGKAVLRAGWDWINTNVFAPIKNGFSAVGQWFSDRWADIKRYWDGGKAVLRAGWDWINTNVFAPLRTGIQVVATWFSDRVADIKGAWDTIKVAFRAVWDWVNANVFDKFKAGLDTLEGWVTDGVARIGRGFRKIANFFRDPINWVINFVWNDGLKVAFDNVAKAIGSDSRLPAAPTIPAFAKGGRAGRGLALVGEEGPELVDFRTPGRVYTAQQTDRLLAAKERDPNLAAALDGGFIDWVRGGLASAADALLSPLKVLIRNTVGQWGDTGRLGGDVAINAMNKLTGWIRGKDESEGAAGLPAASGGAIPGAVPYMSRLARQLAQAAGNPGMTMIARTRSMVGDHKWGGAVDFHSTPAYMGKVANLAAGQRGVRVVLYNRRMWVAGSGWGPQPRSYGGGDPWHTSHTHVGLQRAAASYDDGGYLTPGMSAVANLTRRPEPVLTGRQWADIHRLAVANAGSTAVPSGPVELSEASLDGLAARIRAGAVEVGRQTARASRQYDRQAGVR